MAHLWQRTARREKHRGIRKLFAIVTVSLAALKPQHKLQHLLQRRKMSFAPVGVPAGHLAKRENGRGLGGGGGVASRRGTAALGEISPPVK